MFIHLFIQVPPSPSASSGAVRQVLGKGPEVETRRHHGGSHGAAARARVAQ